MHLQPRTMNDLFLALSVTVLSSTAGLAVAAIIPPLDVWHDPRLWAPVGTLAVNAIWFVYRVYRRWNYRQPIKAPLIPSCPILTQIDPSQVEESWKTEMRMLLLQAELDRLRKEQANK